MVPSYPNHSPVSQYHQTLLAYSLSPQRKFFPLHPRYYVDLSPASIRHTRFEL